MGECACARARACVNESQSRKSESESEIECESESESECESEVESASETELARSSTGDLCFCFCFVFCVLCFVVLCSRVCDVCDHWQWGAQDLQFRQPSELGRDGADEVVLRQRSANCMLYCTELVSTLWLLFAHGPPLER